MIYHFNPKPGFGVIVRDVERYKLIKQQWAKYVTVRLDFFSVCELDRCISCKAKVDLTDMSTFELTSDYNAVCYFCCHPDTERVSLGPDDAYLCLDCLSMTAGGGLTANETVCVCPVCESEDVLRLSSSLKSHSKQR